MESRDFRGRQRGAPAPAGAGAVARLFDEFRGWIDEEIHSLRVARMDDAFFATAKGVQYIPPNGPTSSGKRSPN